MLPTRLQTATPGRTDANEINGPSSQCGAAPRCSNQIDLYLTLTDLFYGPDLPERPPLTSVRLVCIEMLSVVAHSGTVAQTCGTGAVT